MRFISLLSILFFVFLTGCVHQPDYVEVNVNITQDTPNIDTPTTTVTTDQIVDTKREDIVLDTKPVKIEVPSKIDLDVDFASQAPFGNWDELHDEACEEASMITVDRYFSNQTLNEEIMDTEILDVMAWQKDRGYNIDLPTSQVLEILTQYYGLQSQIVSEVTVDRIKYELAQGHLIIVPVAGREINNPYFRSPGPIYHMLVIRGYDSDEFITNEVGTKRGDGFKYKYSTLLNAIHDWNPVWSHDEVTDEQINSQPKRMIVVTGK